MNDTDSTLRLDKALVSRNLLQSRSRAKEMIAAGNVLVNNKVVFDADLSVSLEDTITLVSPDMPWVSRGALKLIRALDEWNINPKGKVALDIGASTGGFTEVLLSRGAKKVYALDVGHAQLAEKLRADARVVNSEGVHIKDVTPAMFTEPLELIVVDVSFISLAHVLPKIKELLAPGGEAIVLVKPQFEVGRIKVKKGIVRDPELHKQVLAEMSLRAKGLGFRVSSPIESPIEGGDGNKEFLLYLRA